MASYANPQNLNRYSYVTNNPMRYTDPTGHMQYEDSYAKKDGKCSASDPSCNWVGKSKDKTKKDKEQDKSGNGKPLLAVDQSNSNDSLGGCEPFDCFLSAVSFGASIGTFGTPPIDAIAFGVDVVATGWSVFRTNEDFREGKISNTRQVWLNGTAVVGVLPAIIHPALGAIGAASSLLNLFLTATGIPN